MAELEALREENEILRERIAQLQRVAFGKGIQLPWEWRLTVGETRIMRALMAREMLSKDAAMMAVYGDSPDEEPDQNILTVFICKIRKKLQPFNITIRTHWGRGWSLSAETRKALNGQ